MKQKFTFILICLFTARFVISGSMVAYYSVISRRRNEEYTDLARQVENKTEEKEEAELIPYKNGEFFLDEYYDLYTQNPDMAGWIKIEDTQINYPVMHTPHSPDYYLRRNFYKEYAYHGTPYIQENCSVETGRTSDNIIVHAHNMDDGSMFGDLEKYMDKEFRQEHETIQFDTLTQRGEYRVIAVFMVDVTVGQDNFEYYKFVNAQDENRFNRFIDNCKRRRLHKTEESAVYGDKLLTLSTCEYSRENGRLVVVAKKVN